MPTSAPHRRAQLRATGQRGSIEVELPSGRRLDALSATASRATEVETSGRMDRMLLAVERLVESGAPDPVLRVPHRHMGLAEEAFERAGVEGRVQNMHNSSGFKVGAWRGWKRRRR